LPDGERTGPAGRAALDLDKAGANGGAKPGSYYGNAIPYLPIDGYPGKIIAVEGTDGVGRSTQITLLREWLEVQGYGVIETGWTRSELMQPTIELAKSSNTLNKLTFVLLYATDFADRLEKEIIPALKAGMIVLADRYTYTAFARDVARGVDRRWVRELYSFAVKPDLAVYFRVPIDTSVDRLMARRVKLKFYEAGMDMGWSSNALESFRIFQGKVLDEYDRLVDEFGLSVVNAVGSITDQQRVFRRLVTQQLEMKHQDEVVDESA